MTRTTVIQNGRVVTPRRVIESGSVAISGSRITDVGEFSGALSTVSNTIDADGRTVMPGLIDLHGDDIERQLFPRQGARVDRSMALANADRTNLFNGVTTKFHAIAFEDDPSENRSVADALRLCREVATADYTLADNRVHVRCELTDESVSAAEPLLEEGIADMASVMHHAPGDGQFAPDEFVEHYVINRDCPSEEAEQLAAKRRTSSTSSRRRRAERIAGLAAASDLPLASHDDETPGDVDCMAGIGATISEYPVTEAAAERATERGLTTTMGAPNLIRGGSLWGNLDVQTAIDEGLVDVLCGDYHPPSLLEAAFVDTGEPLPTRVRRVTAAPADAAGLHDRGRLEPGTRADVILVDPDPVPTVDRAFVAGTEVLQAGRT